MNNSLNIDIRAIAKKLFVATNWILFCVMIVLTVYSIGRGYGGDGVLFIMLVLLTSFGLPYIGYYVLYKYSKQLSKPGEVMAVISAIASILLLAVIVYYIVGVAYLYMNGDLRA